MDFWFLLLGYFTFRGANGGGVKIICIRHHVYKVVRLGKTELLNLGMSSGVRNAFALQNKIHENGKFENGKMFENNFKLIKNHVLEIESIEYFREKKLIIKTVYLKEENI